MTEFTWLDQRGNALPRRADGTQFLRLMGGPCGLLDVRVAVSPAGAVDAVSLEGATPEPLVGHGPGLFGRVTRSRNRMEREGDSWKAAGEIIAVAFRAGAEVGRSRLAVLPANFSDAEYRQMLLEIGLAALSSASWVQAAVGASAVAPGGSGRAVGLGTRADETGLAALLSCVEELDRALATIRRRPILTIRRERRSIPGHRAARSPHGARELLKRPGRRSILVNAPAESEDSVENRFLRWVIEHRLLPLLRLEQVRNIDESGEPDETLERYVFEAAAKNRRLAELAARLREGHLGRKNVSSRRDVLDEAAQKLYTWLNQDPIRSASPAAAEIRPTQRLLGTPGYRDVWLAVEKARSQLGRAAIRGVAIGDAVLRGEVRASWRCYETWCFVQVVRAFAELGGFYTPVEEKTLGELLQVSDGEVSIPRGTPIILRRGSVCVELQYEPRLPSRRDGRGRKLRPGEVAVLMPDILVTIQRGESSPRHFVLDAKYRDYEKQGVRAMVDDLVTTALGKYRDGLSNAAVPERREITGSYILHSDPAPRSGGNDFWGGVAVEEWLPPIVLESLDADCRGVRGHACGLIRLRPDQERDFQLGKLLDMWLQFHVPESGFACSRCGTILEEGRDVRLVWRPNTIKDDAHEKNRIRKAWRERWQTTVICVCPTCSSFWFMNHCRKSGHPIYKLGRRSYHTESRQPWPERGMYVCPICGDDPPPGAIGVPEPDLDATELPPPRE